ncbi:MAG: DUF3883 domain-containing protein [Phenylobacterium sp.]|uniref:DUF3883 domain-containing protein n=1 Tax=Phenylobacterium sp. TaxID=1871053 RepID=UPI001B3F0807|nr:DUF3883 domain-containing protein [Phenylobacterium sp.]MBP7649302.1 DUF3883 domain-containing protein [Phenylobacterium sp.]MBP7818167.1 DUF3883 domain-containing protein [Phenylobacterium sp.]MBP9232729.1 DUF3883 domain-containing protein [Phenylobacterium sp.]MBP9755185.1 DUF3883 domain-containing protein [Phenylobacterium sp.]
MADQAKIGTDWQDQELDLILEDYFAMLQAEQRGEPYVKAHHSRALMDRIGRTHRSVEFKHMNISAVLQELGRPTIRGYKAKANYQGALLGAVERYLSTHPEFDAQLEPPPIWGMGEDFALFEESPPTLRDAVWTRDPDMERLVRKFDPAARDARNRALGFAGEELVVNAERRKLQALDRPDLAMKVRWISQEDGDGAGYDIHSFDRAGQDRLIEVKTTIGSRTTPFYLTRNEHKLSAERPEAFRLYRLFEFSKAPRLFKLQPPLEQAVQLSPEVYRASFGSA